MDCHEDRNCTCRLKFQYNVIYYLLITLGLDELYVLEVEGGRASNYWLGNYTWADGVEASRRTHGYKYDCGGLVGRWVSDVNGRLKNIDIFSTDINIDLNLNININNINVDGNINIKINLILILMLGPQPGR